MKTCSSPNGGLPLLRDIAPHLERALSVGTLPPRKFDQSSVRCETLMMSMRDGTRLATDLYLPPVKKAPAVVVRTPYDRMGEERHYVGSLFALASRGYVVVSQDLRGTGQSEPDVWDYYMYDQEDGYDCIEWVTEQPWYDGFIASFGGSYVGQTQWQMAMHPCMTTIVPHVSGLGFATSSARLHMFLNAYAKTVGKGEGRLNISYTDAERLMVEETLATGYFNEPIELSLPPRLKELFPNLQNLPVKEAQEQLWAHYCSLGCAGRAKFVHDALDIREVTMPDVEKLDQFFGQNISHDRHTLPHTSPAELVASIKAPPLFRTSWYDWFFNDALETFRRVQADGKADIAARARLIISPHSHNTLGYKEGLATSPELSLISDNLALVDLLTRWYDAVREDRVSEWPTVIYYLMGANIWCTSETWPPREARESRLYLSADGGLFEHAPTGDGFSTQFDYDPADPAPTLGGNLVSSVIAPGSVDVSGAQQRPDVISFTSPVLAEDMDIVGHLKMVLHASSTAVDTDFVVRLTDVFPDGRAIQLQNGILRARYRDLPEAATLLEPGAIYELEVDMWATANRFEAGHRVRIDISSADFPHYDRNTNTGGLSDTPIVARQTIFHDAARPSHLVFGLIGDAPKWAAAEERTR
ncbi:CocE/NonD family hydrolase [Sphingosinicella rhizophila]|uniref:CocE/NonD family hydrolase n=1 Tax=Sphingosinicella rhizophila TaxID=3050082 RepID=A0ABU3Q5Y2_9SPHN|nr:CocE/NonD family hydrolase [Sphingosinicella sp. GR2756]MDT9598712.1 CocE/NonD family hydrolase [Sphingosinicella sp. GR2756]